MANNVAYAYKWLIDKGLPPNAAAGIVGNLVQESGVNPLSNQAGGPGRGIAQWSEGARWDSLVAWAHKNGHNPNSLDTQLQWLMIEMRGMGLLDDMKDMHNIEHATRVFMNVFERPDPDYANISGRIDYAKTVADNNPHAKQGGGGGGGGDGKGGDGKGGGGNKDQDPYYGFTQDFLDEHGQIEQLVQKARKLGYSDERFAAELKDTSWWETKTEAQRQWDILETEQPAEAKRRIQAVMEDVQTTAGNLGVKLSHEELRNMSERFAVNQSSANEIAAIIGHKFQIKKDTAVVGQAGVAVDELRAMAHDYGVNVTNNQLEKWTRNILQGDQTTAGLVDRLREQAKLLHPTIAKMLDTQTVKDIMDPYLQQAGNELGIPPDQMKLTDSKWLTALKGEDGGLMSMDEWNFAIRNDQRFGFDKTKSALGQGAQLTSQLAALMGAKG